ncbi:FliH/SctL family protein [Desulfoluna butyratoxydans]|uniref:Flagellar assembly protein FliH n=1 Tax=Desulfoluna butyratoxydans TaxID=231438 RepID=A0A4U8YJF3_9BACT|nr:FliH/SctL family protein [Desulfoluna butyratoxydans]VFQ43517.1 flagellar assembly protein flih/type iii secretion system hrpe [Desulfoluna butyratoxydans]
MTENGFRPLVGVSSGAFETSTVPSGESSGGIQNFHRLEFKQEEPNPEGGEPVETGEAPFAPEAPEPPPVQETPTPPPAPEPPPEPDTADVETGDQETAPATPAEDSGLFEVERQAFEMGFEKGEREGFSKGEERAMEMLVRLENLILGFEGAWRKSCENREEEVVRLALVVAEKVALAKADRDDEMAARSLVEALAALENPGTCTVRVNPDDFDSVERLRGDLFQRVANLQEITILPDGVVEEGEVRLESDNGWLETHARKRLDEVLSRVGEAAGISMGDPGEVPGGV